MDTANLSSYAVQFTDDVRTAIHSTQTIRFNGIVVDSVRSTQDSGGTTFVQLKMVVYYKSSTPANAKTTSMLSDPLQQFPASMQTQYSIESVTLRSVTASAYNAVPSA